MTRAHEFSDAAALDAVLHYWFDEIAPAAWFKVDPAFDAAIRARFGALHARALAGELWGWRAEASGRLAEVIVLDQFSRNLHRGSAQAFVGDGIALVLAQEAVTDGVDALLAPVRRRFLYMPYMHSESPAVQNAGLALFGSLGDADTLEHARRHRAVIAQFGRFPTRNAALGRANTPAEAAFLPGALPLGRAHGASGFDCQIAIEVGLA